MFTDNNLVATELQPQNNPARYNLVAMNEKAGNWLREKRKKLGLRQEDVAQRAGVSTSYISTIERGQKHSITEADLRPEPDKLKRIAKAVKGDPNELLVLYGYAAQPRKAKTAKEALEIMEKLVPGFEGILTAEGITDENAQRILDDFLTVIELHKRRNG